MHRDTDLVLRASSMVVQLASITLDDQAEANLIGEPMSTPLLLCRSAFAMAIALIMSMQGFLS